MPKTDILTIEIGSTITKVNAFSGTEKIDSATALTTPDQVMKGFHQAMETLSSTGDVSLNRVGEIFAMSSAAGGLRMTVHGLTREMTTRAAEEAALGAGANIAMITAGLLSAREVKKIEALQPNLIMLAGGVEYGEEETVYQNAKTISQTRTDAPVIYAGNVTLREDVGELFKKADKDLYIVENVYPGFDKLNIKPVRAVIQQIFSARLIIAPGIDELKKLSEGEIMPVPAACLIAAETLSAEVGDLVVIDVGGATTDVHSIVNSVSKNNLELQVPSRRTVEGDIGLFVSAGSVWEKMGRKGSPRPLKAIPGTAEEKQLSMELAAKAIEEGLVRHAGTFMHGTYLSGGGLMVKGQDLRNVKLVVGTGGGLAGLEGGINNLRKTIDNHRRNSLLPGTESQIRVDRDYVFSACGVFAGKYPDRARAIMLESIGGLSG